MAVLLEYFQKMNEFQEEDYDFFKC
jgi:hypothetical protein